MFSGRLNGFAAGMFALLSLTVAAGLLVSCSSAVNGGGDAGVKDGGKLPSCRTDNDCLPTDQCIKNKCVPRADDGGVTDGGGDVGVEDGGATYCENDSSCPEGYRCKVEVHLCVAAAIIQLTDPLSGVIDYGPVPFGKTSLKSATVKNIGTAELNISKITTKMAVEGDPLLFTITNGTGPYYLKAGATQKIDVQFLQSGTRQQKGTLQISSNDLQTPLLEVGLQNSYKGTAKLQVVDRTVSPMKVLYPVTGSTTEYAVDFGVVAQHDTKEMTVTYNNNTGGDALLEIAYPVQVQKSGNPFSYKFYYVDVPAVEITKDKFPIGLDAQKMLDMKITYSADTKIDADTERDTILTNDPDINLNGGGSTLTLAMNARGPQPEIEVTPAEVKIGDCLINTLCSQKVTVRNAGGADLNLLASSGLKFGTSFTIDPPSIEKTISGGASFEITVKFQVTTTGPQVDTLVLNSNDPATPKLEVPITARAIDPKLVVIVSPQKTGNPSVIDFGKVFAGLDHKTGNVTVTNAGTESLTVSGLSMLTGSNPNYTIQNAKLNGSATGFPVELRDQGQDALTFEIDFVPTTTGQIAGTAVIDSNDAGLPKFNIGIEAIGIYSDGNPCTSSGECASGFCINNRCCKDDCAATMAPGKDINCWRCDVAGHFGTCNDAVVGTKCVDPSCVSKDVTHQAWECGNNENAGKCVDKGNADCDPFSCDPAKGICYLAPCAAHSQCADGYACCTNSCVSIQDDPETCATAPWQGSACGEENCNIALFCQTGAGYRAFWNASAVGNRWYHSKADDCSGCTTYVSHKIEFSVPVGVTYRLKVYRIDCGSNVFDTLVSGKTLVLDKDSNPKTPLRMNNSSFDYWIRVEYVSGASCDPWSLNVLYNKC
ncbi:MAG: choice-of-anchor D domain-containing protein [Myxococcota bacterium]